MTTGEQLVTTPQTGAFYENFGVSAIIISLSFTYFYKLPYTTIANGISVRDVDHNFNK
ncbi:hypothetical protein GCM10027342_43800 [Photobacterium alginatilyticum]